MPTCNLGFVFSCASADMARDASSARGSARTRLAVFAALSLHYALVPSVVHWSRAAPRTAAAPASAALVLAIQAARMLIAGMLAYWEVRATRDTGLSLCLRSKAHVASKQGSWPLRLASAS